MIVYAVISALLLVVFCTLLIYSDYKKGPQHRYWFKTLASVMFIALGSGMFWNGEIQAALPLWIGLCFSLAGDVFLAVFDHKKDTRYFVMGVLGFGAAQIGYSIYFICAGTWIGWSALIAVMITVASQVGMKMFQIKLTKGMLALVTVYSLLLSFAFACGLMSMIREFSPKSLIMAVGMGLFLLSDVVLLFKYFYKEAPKCLTAVNLATYYGAQLLLAMGIGMIW